MVYFFTLQILFQKPISSVQRRGRGRGRGVTRAVQSAPFNVSTINYKIFRHLAYNL